VVLGVQREKYIRERRLMEEEDFEVRRGSPDKKILNLEKGRGTKRNAGAGLEIAKLGLLKELRAHPLRNQVCRPCFGQCRSR
jgi:hypothetical protein